jgi:hypothetical protein
LQAELDSILPASCTRSRFSGLKIKKKTLVAEFLQVFDPESLMALKWLCTVTQIDPVVFLPKKQGLATQ